jgi:phenylalanyl-tRNA synthetase beta chain
MVPLAREDKVHAPVLTLIQKRTRTTKRLLASRGMVEAVTWSFVSKRRRICSAAAPRRWRWPTRSPRTCPTCGRPCSPACSPPPSATLIAATAISPCSRSGRSSRATAPEDQKIAAVRRPARAGRPRRRRPPLVRQRHAADVFDVKADALAVLAQAGAPMAGVQVTPGGSGLVPPRPLRHPAHGPEVYGWFGEVHPRTLEALDVDGPVYAFEIILDAIPAPKAPHQGQAEARSGRIPAGDARFRLPRRCRDPRRGHAQGGARHRSPLVAGVTLFDVYDGKGMEPGKKSIAIEVRLQPRDKTMTDADIDAFSSKLVAEMAKKTGASLRG